MDVADINATDTTQQFPTDSSNDNSQDGTGNDNLQDGSNNEFQHSESADLMECVHGSESTDIENDILVAVLRAFQLTEEANGSQKSFMDILNFGRDMYCKGDADILKKWPKSWSACMAILKEKGYKDPKTHYICINESHPTQWSILNHSTDVCQYCGQPGSIEYHYISLADRVRRWCANKAFCEKMTAHWQQKGHWLHRSSSSVQSYNEIWDGQRFHELRWFWNPQERWLLPVRCPLCTEIISADTLALITTEQNGSLGIDCTYCYRRFSYCPKYAYGGPRNIALIGHWDGWQPFSTSAKHSCGM